MVDTWLRSVRQQTDPLTGNSGAAMTVLILNETPCLSNANNTKYLICYHLNCYCIVMCGRDWLCMC